MGSVDTMDWLIWETKNTLESIMGRRGLLETHINGIESFWGYAKTGLAKFRRVRRESFYFDLKECEFRFNDRYNNLYHIMLRIFRKNPLF